MNAFALGADQEAIRAMALEFAADRMAPFAGEWDRERRLPVETLREAAALGMGAIYVDEAAGGSGLGRLDAALIFEALATGCPSVAAFLSIHNMATGMIARHGEVALREHWIPKLASMEAIAAYALTEPDAGSDAAALRTRATLEGDTYRLDGAKQFISGGGLADLYVVMARTGGEGPSGISALVVPGDTPGLSFGADERKMGWNAQPTRALIFENCRVPVAHRLGAEGQGFAIAMAGLDGGRLNIAACSLGGAWAALDRAVAHMNERRTFGKRLAEHQALRFRMADAATDLEVGRSILWRAAAALDASDPAATTLCAMAKRVCTDKGFAVANEALQMLGGYGYLADYGLEKIVRDLRVHQILEGTNEIMRVIVARQVMGR
ncbi:acyl-CoA dehydrogenase [Aureimonas flava]|uniref:Cyclohexane-1-carbonyl-CoA dehydrogenase n=1 Tax=Aureimonas flava TaxID=2320271 RepID=A0A3A1WQJ0_9HYPH|nr:acyl-CoA dehydrogenase family protein [Aureimonas flava]RIY03326.1 acyl-CoA dehydrogenase [Aureimonas flava]